MIHSLRAIGLAVFGVSLTAAVAAQAPPQQPRQLASFQPRSDAPKYARDRVIVRFRPGTAKSRGAAAHAAVRGQVLRTFRGMRDVQVVRLAEGMQVEAALRAYRKDPAVLYAEPDYIVQADQNSVTPNDPRFSEQWGLQNIQAPQAWGITAGSPSVVVAVIDTGIDYNHPDLNANMFRNTADCNTNGADDDGNGFVDDCYGIDTVNSDSDPLDDHGHGTHVAGIIGAAGNNGVGVAGVNWVVQLMACKFLGEDGSGTISGAIACMEYVAAMKERGVNIVATNNSWGDDNFSQALYEAIDLHRQRGILFIASAGNASSDSDLFPHYPSDSYLPNVIAVAAIDNINRPAGFSNRGRRSVHLGAPGVDILSTVPSALFDPAYQSRSGTSMAAPHVTGVAALLAAQDSTRDWRAIRNLILAGGETRAVYFDPERFVNFLNQTVTRKHLNAYGAMTCTNSPVLSRLQPRTNEVTFAQGLEGAVDIAVLHISCAAPNGEVTVLVDGGAQVITLVDDGQGADLEAGDGIYSARWVPSGLGSHTFTIPNAELRLEDSESEVAIVVDDVFTVQVLSAYRHSTAEASTGYRAISGTPLFLDDDDTRRITPGFPILFGGGRFDSLFVNSNGNVTFSAASVFYFNVPIPAPRGFTPARVAPFWDDLFPPGGGVFWEVIGGEPNRELVIEWRDVPHYNCQSSAGATVRFQVVFREGASDILFNYADVTFGPPCEFADLGASATVGIQVAPEVGTQFSFNETALAAGAAILWTLGAPTPVITRLAPFSVLAGEPGFALEVFGSNFVPLSQVHWNGAALPTTFVNSSQLIATVNAAEIASAGSAEVAVVSPEPGGGVSNTVTFPVYDSQPVPSLTALDPPVVLAVGAEQTVTVIGSGLVSTTVIRWNGGERPTTVLSPTRALVQLQGSDTLNGGFVEVTAFTPAPGGGTSNPLTLTVENPVPVLEGLIPNVVAPGEAFTLQVVSGFLDCADAGNDPCYGTFVPSSVVRWNGADRPMLNGAAQIPASDVAMPGTAEITVFNPPPGGGISNVVEIDIVPRPPNDDIGNAIVISAFPFTHIVDTRTATTEASEPRQICFNPVDLFTGPVDSVSPNSVWYRFTPSANMTINANTFGSTFPTYLSVWRNQLVFPDGVVTCANGVGNSGSSVEFSAVAGTTYYFFISGGGGRLVFNVSATGAATPPGPAVVLSAPTLSFGDTLVGATSPPAGVTLSNGGGSDLNLSGVSLTGEHAADFALANSTTCVSATPVTAAGSCQIHVTFAPSATGPRTAGVTITDNAPGSPHTIALTGNGVAGPAPTPVASLSTANLNFADTPVGSTTALASITLSNTGGADLNVAGVALSGANAADFSQAASSTCSVTSFVLAPGASCSINIRFTPVATGARTASITVTHDAAGSPSNVTLSGTGVSPVPPGFALAAPAISQTIAAGQSANFTLNFTSQGGFTGTITLSCTHSISQGTCSVAPNSLTLPNGGTASATVTVSTTARAMLPVHGPESWRVPRPDVPLLWLVAGVALFLLLRLLSMRPAPKREIAAGTNGWRWAAVSVVLVVASALWSGCGGGGAQERSAAIQGTQAAIYTVTVQASSGPATQVVVLTVRVQ